MFQPVVCASSVERPVRRSHGPISFVSIHTRPTVTRDPLPELYRDVRDAYKILILTVRIRMGKGLSGTGDPRTVIPLTLKWSQESPDWHLSGTETSCT